MHGTYGFHKTDKELVALARSGNKDAFGCLVERYQPMVWRIALRVVANQDVAHDLAQEAILQAYLSLDHLRDAERFRSWLYGIVLNVCRSFLRDQRANFCSLEALMGGLQFAALPLSGMIGDPQEAAEERELHRRVQLAVNALSPKERAATLLFYYEQLSLREIAQVLHVSVGAVKGRLHRARSQLRERLFPVYADRQEALLAMPGRKIMVKVTVADVLEVPEQDHRRSVVLLHDEVGQRILAIWVGEWESRAIALGLRQLAMPRPMTFNFMAKLLEAVGAELEEVRIETLKDDVFYAVTRLRTVDGPREVDARPSDAIALALAMGRPITVADDILANAGLPLPAGQIPQPGLAQGSIIAQVERTVQAAQAELQATHAALPRTPEECQQREQLLLALLAEKELKSD